MNRTVHAGQLRALLATYFRMSLRGKAAGTFSRSRGGKWRGTIGLVLLYAGMGTVAAFGASGSHDPFSYALVLHTLTFVMLGMSLAAESGDLLFSASEHDVLGHLPIGSSTLLVAKAGSLVGFALLLALALNLPALAIGWRVAGMRADFPLVHVGTVVLLAAFSTATVVFTYGLVVRLVDRERFDSVAAWSQAGLSAAFLGLSQGLTHLMELPILRADASFCVVFPPAWFAALDALAAGVPSWRTAELSALGIGSTVVLGWVAVTRLASGYAGAVARLAESQPLAPRAAREGRATGRLARWWPRDPVERAAFRLAAVYLRRDREIRARLYPSLGFFLLLPVAQLVGHAAYRFTAAALLPILLIGMLPSICLEALRVSSHCAAAEMFAVVPVASAGPLFQGVRKATVVYLLVPGTVISALWIALVDPHAFPLALPSLLALPVLSLLPAALRDYLPLSVPPSIGRQSTANILLGLVTTVAGAATISAAWFAWRAGWLPWLVVGEAVVLAIVWAALARHIGRRPIGQLA
jgi:ABC-2 type transport system permease protein